MFPLQHHLHEIARQHQRELLAQAAQAHLARQGQQRSPRAALQTRMADALYALGVALSNLAGALGSERAKLAARVQVAQPLTGASEGGALRWAGEAGKFG